MSPTSRRGQTGCCRDHFQAPARRRWSADAPSNPLQSPGRWAGSRPISRVGGMVSGALSCGRHYLRTEKPPLGRARADRLRAGAVGWHPSPEASATIAPQAYLAPVGGRYNHRTRGQRSTRCDSDLGAVGLLRISLDWHRDASPARCWGKRASSSQRPADIALPEAEPLSGIGPSEEGRGYLYRRGQSPLFAARRVLKNARWQGNGDREPDFPPPWTAGPGRSATRELQPIRADGNHCLSRV